MKKIWLKLVVAFVLVSLVIFLGIIFWPNETEPTAESKYTGQAQKEDKSDLRPEPNTQQPVVKQESEPVRPRGPQIPREERLYPQAEKLYQMASRHKQPVSSSAVSYKILVSCCQQIFNKYPNSPQAGKARKLPQSFKRM